MLHNKVINKSLNFNYICQHVIFEYEPFKFKFNFPVIASAYFFKLVMKKSGWILTLFSY